MAAERAEIEERKVDLADINGLELCKPFNAVLPEKGGGVAKAKSDLTEAVRLGCCKNPRQG